MRKEFHRKYMLALTRLSSKRSQLCTNMASFVAEVLSSAGNMEREEINEKLSTLGRRMEELKLEIHSAISASTTAVSSFEPNFGVTVTLSDKVKATSLEMEELCKKIDTEIGGQLNISTGEFQLLKRQLEQVTMVMSVLDKMTQAQQLMENIATVASKGKYLEAALSVTMLEEAFKQPVCERENEIKILVAVRQQCGVLKQKLILDLNDAWKETVSWKCLDLDALSNKKQSKDAATSACKEDKASQLELRLPKSDSASEQEAVKELVTALETLGQLDRKVKVFGGQLCQHVFSGLAFIYQKVSVSEKPLAEGKEIVIKATGKREKPTYMDVFSVVGSVLDLLNDSLLHVTVKRKDGDVSLMTLLGDEIAEKMLEGVVKECLSAAIPSTQQELGEFDKVIAVTQKFHDRLVGLGFVAEASRTLLDYVENVNILFANKKCQALLERARSLMTSDIHDTVLISSDAPPGELPPLDKSGHPAKEKGKRPDVASEPLLSNSAFCMPTCRISLCAQEIMELAYSTLNEAVGSSDECAKQMFYAVRNMFELFCSVFPTYHAHSLANFPQLAALHHNNCMFLAHHLLTLGHQFKASLPKDINPTFVDLVQDVRSLGTSAFLHMMNTQKAVLEQYMEGAEGFSAVNEESNYSAAEKSLKQALHQLKHLQKVWQDVLPVTVYCKAIGVLLNHLLTLVMDHIIALEDISSEAARKLFTLLKLVDEKGEWLLLGDGGEGEGSQAARSRAKVDLHRYVAGYAKFTELQLVLNGSLQEIADRWADGMGPLSAEFPPNELKQLIRALFQNTDRRAAVLAKIK